MTQKQYFQIIEKVGENLNDFLYSSDERYRSHLTESLGWTPLQAKRFACWDWTHGVGLYGIYKLYQFTKDERYLDYIEAWPVSYTHLDVYKRQALQRADRPVSKPGRADAYGWR